MRLRVREGGGANGSERVGHRNEVTARIGSVPALLGRRSTRSTRHAARSSQGLQAGENARSMRKEGSGRDSSMTRALCRRVYCAPELLMGKVHYGTEVDIWSLGVVAAELIGGDVCPPIQRARASSATPPTRAQPHQPRQHRTAPTPQHRPTSTHVYKCARTRLAHSSYSMGTTTRHCLLRSSPYVAFHLFSSSRPLPAPPPSHACSI